MYASQPQPRVFWGYFPPYKASFGGLPALFTGEYGSSLLNGSWVHFSLQSQGSVWTAYVNGVAVGSINLGTPYAYLSKIG